MEEILFSKGNLPATVDPTNGWTEGQYNQLKNQIIAYKYLIRNMGVPSEILEKIRSSEVEEWEKMREKNLEKIQETYEKRFEDHDLSMKELGVYFKKRMKDQEMIPRLFAERNYVEEIEYNADTEIENRKFKLANYLSHLKENSVNDKEEASSIKNSANDLIKNAQTELKLLKIYNLQKKIKI